MHNSREVHTEYFNIDKTVWRLIPYKDTAMMDLLQHEHPHNVILTMEHSLHPYSDYHHCQVCYPVTIYTSVLNIKVIYSTYYNVKWGTVRGDYTITH